MTTTAPQPRTTPEHGATPSRPRWPLVGVAAGVLGVAATLVTDVHPMSWADEKVTADVLVDVSRATAHISVVLGFLAVGCLLVLAASWRRHVEPRAASSTAALVVTHGFVAAAGALALGYGYKGMLAIYLPGGLNANAYDTEALYVMYVLNDFGSFIGWFGVTVSAIAIAWMSLRERTISRWIGLFTLLPVLAVTGLAVGTGLPGFPGVAMPLWMLVTFLGLTFGRSPVVR